MPVKARLLKLLSADETMCEVLYRYRMGTRKLEREDRQDWPEGEGGEHEQDSLGRLIQRYNMSMDSRSVGASSVSGMKRVHSRTPQGGRTFGLAYFASSRSTCSLSHALYSFLI